MWIVDDIAPIPSFDENLSNTESFKQHTYVTRHTKRVGFGRIVNSS